jgi:molecular chaperone DnaK
MKDEAAANAAADAAELERISKINGAEQYAYSLKKTLEQEELKDKITDDERSMLNEKLDALLDAVKAKNVEDIDAKKSEVEKAFNPIAERLNKQQEQQGNPEAAGFQGEPVNEAQNQNTTESAGFGDGNVEEAEYTEVNE